MARSLLAVLPLVALPLASLSLATMLAGCEIPPSHVYSADVDDALARKHYKTMCVGLEMKDDDVRRYSADRFESIADNDPADPAGIEAGKECVCSHLKDDKGRLDLSVAAGLKGSQREDMVGCLAAVVEEPDLPNKREAISALANTAAPVGREALSRIALDASNDSEVRVAAVQSIAGNLNFRDPLLKLASSDGDATVRAAATSGLNRFKDDAEIEAAVVKLATEDADGAVRGTALQALKTLGSDKADEMICTAMMEDEDGEVRKRAVMAFRGTKRAEAIKCLRDRTLTQEDDSGVRGALLTVLGGSPSQDAADVLCDAIPSWMKWYAVEDMPDVVPSADIAKAQNDRDWERSYECLQRAYAKRGGYSCYGKRYIAWWYEQVGGSAFIPKCPPKYPD